MDFSQRNRKVAIARWAKVHKAERARIKKTRAAFVYKAAICGFLAGDGSVKVIREKGKSSYRYEIDFFPDDRLMLKEYMLAINYIYGKRPTIRVRDKVFNVVITSRVVLSDIRENANFGKYSWDLPHRLFSIKGAKEAWLRAFFSAEGYVTNKVIRVQTVNKAGMLSVSKILKELNIEHRYYEYRPKNKNYSLVSIIVIMKKEARKQFSKKVGFWHSKKTKKLKESLSL